MRHKHGKEVSIMKKQHIMAILFLSAVWGLSEAFIGGWMYNAGMRQAPAIILAVVAMGVMAITKVYVPKPGSVIALAAMAMLYKFLNTPFFACHLLAILMLGISFEVVHALAKGRRMPLVGLLATYVGFASFAAMMVLVFRYEHWTNPGWSKVIDYVAVTGSLAALGAALIVPLADRFARTLVEQPERKLALPNWAVMSAACAGAWAFAIIRGITVL